jgi:hypothetical protein
VAMIGMTGLIFVFSLSVALFLGWLVMRGILALLTVGPVPARSLNAYKGPFRQTLEGLNRAAASSNRRADSSLGPLLALA